MNTNPIMTILAGLAMLAAANGAHAVSVTLFDAEHGTLPTAQGELTFISFGGTQAIVADGVQTQSQIGNAAQYGYGTGAWHLDRHTGVELSFDLRVDAETHANANRAGFSVLLITADLLGIELSAWANELWVQNVGFTHGEGAAFDTGAALTSYALRIVGDQYTVLANEQPLFSGLLRDYSAFGFPYDVANSIFIGDNTTSAGASVTLGDIDLRTAFVPLPGALAMLLPALAMLGLRRRQTDVASSTRDGNSQRITACASSRVA